MKSHTKYLISGIALASLIFVGTAYVRTYSADDETVIEDEDTYNNLIQAVEDDNFPRVRRLLREGIDPNIQDATGLAPLHYAAHNRNHRIINLLLSDGADANIQDDMGSTPLHAIADSDDIASAQALLDAGADTDLIDEIGKKPIDLAYFPAMMDLLNQASENRTNRK